MKMKTNFNFGALNSSGRRQFSLQKGKPNWVKIISLSASLAALLGIAGCALVQNNEQPEASTTPTAQVQTVDENKDETPKVEEKDEYSLLIDQLNISGLHMVDNLTPKIDAEVQAQLEALVPEGGTVIDSSNVYIAPDGSAWESEEDYLKFINNQNENQTGAGETVQSGYMAPDGTVWTSEDEYLKYIAGQNTGDNGTGTNTEDTKVEGNYYMAPDGSVWESEEAYLKYVNASQNTEVENGEVVDVENDGLYKAPDGTYWESEQDYLDSLKSESSNEETPVEEEKGQSSGTEDNYYIDPEGNRWESKEMYDEYIKGLAAATEEVEEPVVVEKKEENKAENTSSEFYVAPDGELWVSEQAYLDSLGTTTETGMGTETGDETVTEEGVNVIPESEYVAEPEVEQTVDNSNYYVDEYGNYWASYEDYVAYMQMMAQEENGKQR